jgi:hypothetical protein
MSYLKVLMSIPTTDRLFGKYRSLSFLNKIVYLPSFLFILSTLSVSAFFGWLAIKQKN